jgi:hypothetical protein
MPGLQGQNTKRIRREYEGNALVSPMQMTSSWFASRMGVALGGIARAHTHWDHPDMSEGS